MNLYTNYTVEFGKIALTLIYRDDKGGICFIFDVAPSSDQTTGKWTMFLGKQALSEDGSRLLHEISTDRAKLAFERARAYVLSCGYQVDTESH